MKLYSTLICLAAISGNVYSQTPDPMTAMKTTMGMGNQGGIAPPLALPSYSGEQVQPSIAKPQGLPESPVLKQPSLADLPPLSAPPPKSVEDKLASLSKVSADNLSAPIQTKDKISSDKYEKAVNIAKTSNEKLLENQKFMIENDEIFRNRYLRQKKFEERQEARYQEFLIKHPNSKKKIDKINSWVDAQNKENTEQSSEDPDVIKTEVTEGLDSNGNPTTIRKVYKKSSK